MIIISLYIDIPDIHDDIQCTMYNVAFPSWMTNWLVLQHSPTASYASPGNSGGFINGCSHGSSTRVVDICPWFMSSELSIVAQNHT